MEHIEDEKIWTGLKQHEERVLTTLFDMYYEKLYLFAEKFIYEKRQIVALLKQHGIMALLTSPARLTVDVINKYIEIKTRQLL